MNAETLFSVCNMIALAGWLLLIFAPGWVWTSRLVFSGSIPLLLGVVYLALIVVTAGSCR